MQPFKIIKTPDRKIISFLGLKLALKRRHKDKTALKFKTLTQKTVLEKNGVSIVGCLNDNDGEAKVCKEVINALKNSNIPHEVIGLNAKNLPRYKNIITFTTKNFYKPEEYNNIPVLWWEFESGMENARPYAFENVKAVLAFSKFCAGYLKKIAPKNIPVLTLPCPLEITKEALASKSEVRRRYNIKQTAFVCFFNFSYFSSYDRKNPEAVLKAFATAFDKEPDAMLVIKTTGAKKRPALAQRLESKINELNLKNKLILINEELTAPAMYSLINAADVYISMHRGEGLGLGMLEAMLLKKPVVATNYGGNTDFMDKNSACLVDYKKTAPAHIDLEAYKGVKEWAEPDITAAARYLKELKNNPKYRATIGNNGSTSARKYASRENFLQLFQTLVHNNFDIKEAHDDK